MLFTVIVIAAVIAIAVYVAKKTKTTPTSTFVEETFAVPSIHEEIAKTVEEAKNLAPIVDEVSKPKVPKAPKTAAPKTTAPTMAAKKTATKNKQVNA